MKNTKLNFTIFILFLSLGVFAQGPPGGQGGRGQGRGQQKGGKPNASEILSKLDTNHDDVIDKEEASKERRGKISDDFDEIDTNSDAFIDLEELEASLNNRKKPKKVSPEKLIKDIDDNNDGTLNELEVAAKEAKELSKHFNQIDANNDNELDLDELKSFFSNNKTEKPKR
ncbi:EF-hand domain-containing protein [Lacinutrix iliipiscaria]|uniref:EF-hand domain-containing protein n=1 Tax=Lacinutrix iliipiscaria TaxID=1230532 RepID=A0ABW5WMR3_9FLAO